MSKFSELLAKTIVLYGPLAENNCIVEQGFSGSFKVYVRYNNSDIYQGYQINMIPSSVDRVLYGYLQYDNCLLNYDLKGLWTKFLNNELDCIQGDYATGNPGLNIYSTDPYADFASWPPNDISLYEASNNEVWNYNVPFASSAGLNNVDKISNAFNISLSLLFYGPNTVKQINDISNNDHAISKIEDFYNEFLPSAALTPFRPIYTRVNNNINGLDIYFNPGDNYLQNLDQDNLAKFLSFLSDLSDTSKVGTSFVNISLTITPSPYLAQMFNYASAGTLANIVDNIDSLIINAYDYQYFYSDFIDSTRCYSPLFFDIEQIKTPLKKSQNILSATLDYFNIIDLASKTDIFINNFNQLLGHNNQALLQVNSALVSDDLAEIGGFLNQAQEKLLSALEVINNNFINDDTALSLLTNSLNNVVFSMRSLILAANYNIHSTIASWKDAAAINNLSKIFIAVSLKGKQVNNIYAEDEDQSLYRIFNASESNVNYVAYNDQKFSNPIYDANNLASSIKAQIQSGKLEESYNQNAACTYAYNNNDQVFVSYENELSIIMKSCYALYTKLGGLVFSDLASDKSNELVNLAMQVNQNYSNYCKANYSSDTYPGSYDFSFENIDRLISISESARLIGLDG